RSGRPRRHADPDRRRHPQLRRRRDDRRRVHHRPDARVAHDGRDRRARNPAGNRRLHRPHQRRLHARARARVQRAERPVGGGRRRARLPVAVAHPGPAAVRAGAGGSQLHLHRAGRPDSRPAPRDAPRRRMVLAVRADDGGHCGDRAEHRGASRALTGARPRPFRTRSRMAHADRRALALLAVLTLVWGTNWTLMPIAMREVSVFTFRAIGSLAAGTILLGVARARGQPLAIRREDWPTVVAASFAYLLVWNVASAWAAILIPSGQAAVLGFTMPFWA